MNPNQPPAIRSLILVPAVITLAVTAARLALELAGAPAWLSSNEAGGPMAVVGIVWLPLLFGPYFALRIRPHVAGTKPFFKRLAATLFAYGLAARIPVVLITIPLLLAGWGTHYEKFPFEAGFGLKVLATLGAQVIFWAGIWTVGTGLIFGWATHVIATFYGAARRIETEPR